MALFEWTPKYSVGVSRFDLDHQALFELINDLHDRMRIGRDRSALESTFERLIEYTEQHFQAEEKAMMARAYPAFADHKTEHDNLRSHLESLRQTHTSGVRVTVDLINFLLRWWTDHILRTDREYTSFFHTRTLISRESRALETGV